MENVKLNEICHISQWNCGREDVASFGNPLTLIPQLAEGWQTARGIMQCHAWSDAKHLEKELGSLPDYKAIREAQRAQLLATEPMALTAYGVDKTQALLAFDALYKDAKGAWIKPRLWAFSGNRRSVALPFAVVLWQAAHPSEEYLVAVDVQPFLSLEDTIRHQLAENDLTTKQAYSSLGQLRIVRRLFDSTSSATAVERIAGITHGTGQKLWAVAMLDKAFPGLNLVKRCGTEPALDPVTKKAVYVQGGHIPLRSLAYQDVYTLLGKLDDKGKVFRPELKAKYVPGESTATVEQVEAFIAGELFGRKTKGSVILRKDALEKWQAIFVVRKVSADVGEVLSAVLKGNESFFASL